MERTNIILENGIESVNGIFYVYNSKYYFMYTKEEIVDDNYVQLYVVKVCKEIQNTQNGPIDTGYMLGIEISDSEEWSEVQKSITKIVNSKKSGIQDKEIQYLPINMLVNLKIINNNKFKLMKELVENYFNSNAYVRENSTISTEIANEDKVESLDSSDAQKNTSLSSQTEDNIVTNIQTVNPIGQPQVNSLDVGTNNYNLNNENNYDNSSEGDVIIDYRTKFFEEQDKNKELEDQINKLNEKLNSIRQILN